MRLQGMRPGAHIPTFPLYCSSVRDHFEILKHTAKGVGRNFPGGPMGKTRPKIAPLSLPLL